LLKRVNRLPDDRKSSGRAVVRWRRFDGEASFLPFDSLGNNILPANAGGVLGEKEPTASSYFPLWMFIYMTLKMTASWIPVGLCYKLDLGHPMRTVAEIFRDRIVVKQRCRYNFN